MTVDTVDYILCTSCLISFALLFALLFVLTWWFGSKSTDIGVRKFLCISYVYLIVSLQADFFMYLLQLGTFTMI